MLFYQIFATSKGARDNVLQQNKFIQVISPSKIVEKSIQNLDKCKSFHCYQATSKIIQRKSQLDKFTYYKNNFLI